MRRLLAVAAACLLILCACSPFKEKNDLSDLPILQLIHEELPPEGQPWRVNIYRYDDATGMLVSEAREIEVGSFAERARLLFQAFLGEGMDVGLGKTGVQLTFLGAELTNNIVNVYFSSPTLLSDRQRLIITAAAANTAVDNLGVAYANVFINSSAMSIQGLPCGLFLKSDLDILNVYDALKSAYAFEENLSRALTVNLPLYYLSDGGNMALPEVRSVSFGDGTDTERMAADLIYQLYIGPETDEHSRSPIKDSFSPQLTLEDEDTGETIQTLFPALSMEGERLLFQNAGLFLNDPGHMDASLACLYYTFSSVFQNLREIQFVFDENAYLVTRENAGQFLGRKVTVYFPDEDLIMLTEYTRVVSAGSAMRAETPAEILMELFSSGAGSGYHIFPAGLKEDFLLSLKIAGEYAILDFKADFYRYLDCLTESEQRSVVYSLINTLCMGIGRVRAVQFCVDGEYAGIAGENLNLFSPLLPDMGIMD